MQARLAVHATHAPVPLQTSSTAATTSQAVPGAIGVAVSTHCCVPVVQLVTPATHRFGFEAQASPAVQALQVPPLQTSGTDGFTSQVVPFGFTVAVSTQTEVPVVQEVDAVEARVRVAWRRPGRRCTRCRRRVADLDRGCPQDGAVRLGRAALFTHCDSRWRRR